MTPKQHLIERLRALCAGLPGGVDEVADETDSSAENLKQILAGTKLPSGAPRGVGPNLQKRLDARYPGWSGLSPMPISLDSNAQYPAVRRVRFKLQAGVSGFEVESIDDDGPPIVFRRDWFDFHGYRPDRLLAARVNGASMEPTLYDSDVVVINTAQATPKDGHAFAINYEGVLSIKRLVRDGGAWLLRSDNPDKIRYSDKNVHEGVTIIGEVIYRQSERI